ncbi:modifier of mdg4 isoform X1 [Polyergus mexicanus]|uniref:modifier of mdg4 isoform X1 n=1 Tax=Polyergus mexicanus TaxID=615972 RepID=UPI0038B4EAB7
MEDDQQFCLRWNNHQSTLIQNFDTLLESGTLVDCTLAAEGKTLKAHKVVLSACSPYFECLLSEHYDKHPVFILKDVKFKELKAMMDYMYRGEVNISQDQLAALLKAAESLQIKGLSESKTAGSSKTESRPQKTVSQPIARVSPSLDIPHASSGLTIEKNKVPRQSMAQGPVGDIPEDTASPQGSKRLCSREGSQSPTTRKRNRFRRRSLGEDNTIEMQDASNSSDMPQQMSVPALGITPVADEKVHADSTDSLGRSALMTQLTKPADEMLQLPLEKPEPNDNLIEPKSEYLEESEECVEDLTLDDDMNDLNDMEQDNNRAGPSHDPTQHPAGLGAWHVTGDRSNAGGVVGTLTGAGATGATDEMFLTPQEATAQQQRDSQEGEISVVKKERPCEEAEKLLEREKEKNKSERNKRSNLTNGVTITSIAPRPSTSITPRPSTSTDIRRSKVSEVISLSDSENSDNEGSSPWTNSKNVQQKPQCSQCPHCGIKYERRHHLIKHITMTCISNPDSKANKEAGKFRCVDCGRNYKQAKALRYHQRHECQQMITCPDCHRTMRGTFITERHKQNHCVKKRSKKIKQEDSPDELFIDDSSIEF